MSEIGGVFIVLEGPEGAGKSTQLGLLAERLRAAGHAPVVTKEPGGTPVGERIRATLLLEPDLQVSPMTEFLLYSASRAEHVAALLRPALSAGRVVLSDRFYGSSVAYQGYGRGLALPFIRAVTEEAVSGVHPDLVVLLDLPPEEGLRRIAARGAKDRLERADLAFHERVRAGFLAQAQDDPRWTVLDAAQDEAALAEAVWAATSAHLAVGR